MTRNRFSSALYPLLLVTALVAALWLANVLEQGTPLFPRQGEAASDGSSEPSLAEGEGPIFSPPGGAYDHSLLLSIRPSHPRAQVIFATGGHVPTLTVGTLYERPLLLDASAPAVTVVRAREVVNGVAGPVVSASYAVGLEGMGDTESALPILSIIADPLDLWDAECGIMANFWRRGQEWERLVHVTYIERDRSLGFEISAGLRVHGSGRAERCDGSKHSFRLYFRNEYGAARLETPLLFGDDFDRPRQRIPQSYKRLLLQAGDRSGHWTLLDEQLVSDVAADVGGRTAQGRFVLLFLNGELWGVYRLSERFDRFFLEDHFGTSGPADLIRNGDIAEGDSHHWDALMDWLATHDLADETNYAYVQTQIDVDDFTDYAILQAYFGFPADLFSAARQRVGGGRWFWLYGDRGTGPALREDLEPSLLKPSQAGNDRGDLSLLLHSLLENPRYRARFAGRAADLLNTALAPATMGARIDRLAAQVRPTIEYETACWPALTDGSTELAEAWERNVAALRDVVRHRPDTVRQQIAEALDLQGTAPLSFHVTPDGGGTIFVAGVQAPASSWSGTYFLGTDVQAIAVPAPGYVFDGWESGQVEASPLAASDPLTITVDRPYTLTARFSLTSEDDRTPRPNDVIFNEYWINDNGTRYTTVGNRPIEGDWLELLVTRPGTIDLRGWRVTDNDTKARVESEGSIILPQLEALAAVPHGTVILIIATESTANAAYFGRDDLDPGDRRMAFYVGNGNLDVSTDPGFGIGRGDDNLVLLAPGLSPAFADDVGVDFIAEGDAVTALSFGVLADGVVFESPFRGLGGDDGALFAGDVNNDDGEAGWIVPPPADQSGDGARLDVTSILTPGAPNYRQRRPVLQSDALRLSLAGLVVVAVALGVRSIHTKRSASEHGQSARRRITGR